MTKNQIATSNEGFPHLYKSNGASFRRQAGKEYGTYAIEVQEQSLPEGARGQGSKIFNNKTYELGL